MTTTFDETPDEPDDFPAPEDLADDDARLDEPDLDPDGGIDDATHEALVVEVQARLGRPPVELVISTGGRHIYRVGESMLPSVTTLLRAVAKPALPSWAARATAEWVVRNLDTMVDLASADTQAAVDVAKGAPWRQRDDAALRGTEAHRLIGAGIPSEHVVDPDLRSLVAGYEQWLIDEQGTPVAHELPVGSLVHGWAGTIDLVVDFPRGLEIVDLKTSRTVVDREGRLYPENVLQVAAYAACEIAQPFDLIAGSVLHLQPGQATEHRAFVTAQAEPAARLSGVPDLDDLVAVMDAVATVAGFLGMAETS